MPVRIPTYQEINRELARRCHLDFLKYTWQNSDPLKIGLHTREISARFDKALEDYRNRKSTFLIIKVPPRHGKSDMLSRYGIPRFLGLNPEAEVIQFSYSAELSESFSKDARRIMRSPQYAEVFPEIGLSRENQGVEQWAISVRGRDTRGKAQFVGIGGSITGKGGDLILGDDFCRNRQDAESAIYRDRTWDSFCNDIMTRRAPVCIVIIMATAWHVDDLFGRIKRKMAEDENFPRFEEINFPAFSERYPTGTLFPERFDVEWYNGQRAVLGEYGTAALMQGNPRVRGGNVIRVDKINYLEPRVFDELTAGMRFSRGWDIASSEKERFRDDPDYTSGCLAAVSPVGKIGVNVINGLFIKDYVRGRWEAGARNNIIVSTAIGDGPYVSVGVEAFGGYKDAYTQVRDALQGIRGVSKVNLPGDKAAKAAAIEPIFESGNVYVRKGPWNEAVVSQWADFPSGAHDDDVDSMVVAYEMRNKQTRAAFIRGL
jgi:predicted phage terminase large subunit-like protein